MLKFNFESESFDKDGFKKPKAWKSETEKSRQGLSKSAMKGANDDDKFDEASALEDVTVRVSETGKVFVERVETIVDKSTGRSHKVNHNEKYSHERADRRVAAKFSGEAINDDSERAVEAKRSSRRARQRANRKLKNSPNGVFNSNLRYKIFE